MDNAYDLHPLLLEKGSPHTTSHYVNGMKGIVGMAKVQIAEKVLLQLINRRIKDDDHLDGDCRDCRVTGLYRYPEPPAGAANWSIPSFTGPPSCAALIARIQAELASEFDLLVEA